MTKQQRVRNWIASLEARLQKPNAEFSAETLNALLRIVDYPWPYIMDFEPGAYPPKVGKRILRMVRERLQFVRQLGAHRRAIVSSADLKVLKEEELVEVLLQEIERLPESRAEG